MRKKVWDTITKYEMFPKNSRIYVGLSGGADSVALLHLLHSWQESEGWQITAIHIHHGLRGQAADADAAFAEKYAASLSIPCLVQQYDVAAEAKRRGKGEEETGRELRYAAFQQAAGKDGRIAVAHHRKDQAETVLLHLCRGTGLQGLTGMAPVRGQICRPLLFCSREEIEAYCHAQGLAWREDATNQEALYARNKLRLWVLPLLAEINPQAEAHIAEMAQLLAEEEAFLQTEAERYFRKASLPSQEGRVGLSIAAVRSFPPAMRRRVLRLALGQFAEQDVSRVRIAALEDLLQKESGKRRTLFSGICGENRYGELWLFREEERPAEEYCYQLFWNQEICIPEAGIRVGVFSEEKKCEISAETYTKEFDYDKIEHTFYCRSRRAGDRIALQCGRKKIKELFIDEKLPREKRSSYPLIVAGEEVLWVPGLRESAQAAVGEETTHRIWIRIRRMQK